MRRVVVSTVPAPDSGDKPKKLGRMIDPQDGREPFGVATTKEGTRSIDSMLLGGDGNRLANFERFHSGWSNGYVETKAA